MRIKFLVILSILVLISCSRKLAEVSSPKLNINEAQATLEEIVNYNLKNSIYRNTVNWDTLIPQIYELATDAKSIDDIAPALKFMLKSLGDEHGQIYYNNQMLANYYGPTKEHQMDMQVEIYNEIQFGAKYKFHSQILRDSIGYLRIVKLQMGDDKIKAKNIQDKLCDLVSSGAKYWVLDLRYNGGGNLIPMAEGIAPIIGDGIVGGAKGVSKDDDMTWKVMNQDFYMEDYSLQLKNECGVKTNPKLAVLISSYTASSGEALAVILKGRKNTKFFGNKTFGFVTGTNYENLNDSIAVNISVNYYRDRNGKIYDKYVDVDKNEEFVEVPLSEEDNAINSAIKWIQELETDDNKRR